MPNPKPTIYNVAQEAGVSIATVSRVLNSPTRVNPNTRTAVMEAIDRLGFVPKAESRARAMMSTGRIGVLIPFFTAPSFVQRVRGITSVLSRNDYEMVIYPVDTQSRMVSYLETLPINQNLDGLIIVSVVFDKTITNRLLENKLETVLIEFSNHHFSSLTIDDVKGGHLAAEYLIGKGHRDLAFVGGSDLSIFGLDPIAKRYKGYRQAIEEAGLELPENRVFPFAIKPEAALATLIDAHKPIAIFAATDLQAILLLKEARRLGLRVPEDLAVVGFDDLDMADYFGLTTIRQPLDESGRIAAELLLARLAEPARSVQHIQLPLTVVERDTV